MDLESESSARESVDDNGLIQHGVISVGDDGKSLDNGSCSDESVKLVSTCTARTSKNETAVELSKTMNFDSLGGAYSPISKGQGLRKWRRIRRELVKDTPANLENSKVLKRGLSHSEAKQMQFQSPEVKQDSQGSVNMFKNTGDGFEILRTGYDSRFMAGIGFSAGMDSEKEDDQSSKSSAAARAPKVIRYEKPMIHSGQRGQRVENSKKHRGERVKIDKENSHSSLESDSRKHGGRTMDYNGEKGDINGETSKRKDNEGGEGEESINRFSEGLDPLTEAIDGFLSLQEALKKEVQQFLEIGKEPVPLHHEGASEVSSPHSEIVILVNNVEELEIKLEETRSLLEVKESHIRELESTTNLNKHPWGETGIEKVVEDIFRERIEAEIEYLIYSRSMDNLNSQMKLIEEQEALAGEQTNNMLGEVESKAANLTNESTEIIRKRACKTISCFLILFVLLLFISHLLPDSEILVPT